MKQLFWLTLLFISCADVATTKHSNESVNKTINIDGQRIWAIYDHGGSLPEIDAAMFSITNSSNKAAYLQGLSLEYITGDIDSLGVTTVVDSKPVDSLNCKKCFFENQKVSPHRIVHMEMYFNPFPVEVSYHHNYQALRLKMTYGKDTVVADAILDVEREEPFEI